MRHEIMSSSIDTDFSQLFDNHSDAIYRLCLFKTSNSEVAQDITQDVFTKFYEYLHTNELPENPKSFLYHMARNKIIDHYRKHKTDSLEQVVESGIEFPQRRGAPEAEVMADYQLVIDTINQLDRAYREPLYMRLVEEYGVSEIAKLLDLSPSNVSVRINRGKKQLAKLLHI